MHMKVHTYVSEIDRPGIISDDGDEFVPINWLDYHTGTRRYIGIAHRSDVAAVIFADWRQ